MEQTGQSETVPFWTKAIHVAAYPFSAVVGLVYGQTTVRDTVYNNIKKHGGLAEIRSEYEPAVQKLVTRTGDSAKNIVNEIAPTHLNYWEKVTARFEEMGFKSSKDYWNALHKNEKMEIAFTAAGVAAVTLGVVLTVAESMKLWNTPKDVSHVAKLEAEPQKEAGRQL